MAIKSRECSTQQYCLNKEGEVEVIVANTHFAYHMTDSGPSTAQTLTHFTRTRAPEQVLLPCDAEVETGTVYNLLKAMQLVNVNISDSFDTRLHLSS